MAQPYVHDSRGRWRKGDYQLSQREEGKAPPPFECECEYHRIFIKLTEDLYEYAHNYYGICISIVFFIFLHSCLCKDSHRAK